MKIIQSPRDTFHYNGADYGFDAIYLNNFCELDNLIKEQEAEGYTRCYIYHVFNTWDDKQIMPPPHFLPKICIRIKFIK